MRRLFAFLRKNHIYFIRYRADKGGWTLIIGLKFFYMSKFGTEKYIKQNDNKRYYVTFFRKKSFTF
jgi:hypothetical protein